MSLPFARSMRSLQTDSYRFSLALLISSIILLTAWAAWFFLARLTLYETGQIVGTTRRGTVVAALPLEASGKIRRGQLAILHGHHQTFGSGPDILEPLAGRFQQVIHEPVG